MFSFFSISLFGKKGERGKKIFLSRSSLGKRRGKRGEGGKRNFVPTYFTQYL